MTRPSVPLVVFVEGEMRWKCIGRDEYERDEKLFSIWKARTMQPYYSAQGIEIYHGDCRDVLPHLAGVHLVVTSPPYNKAGLEGFIRTPSKTDSWSRRNIKYEAFDDFVPELDYQAQQIEVLTKAHAALVDGGSLFYNHKPRFKDYVCTLPTEWLLKTPLKLRQEIIWDRSSGPNIDPIKFFSTTERVYWLFSGTRPRYFDSASARHKEIWTLTPDYGNPHPAPFPYELAARCIAACSQPSETVLDMYMGSGTTLDAAKRLGRRAIGIEIEERYCDIAARRLSQEVMDFAL